MEEILYTNAARSLTLEEEDKRKLGGRMLEINKRLLSCKSKEQFGVRLQMLVDNVPSFTKEEQSLTSLAIETIISVLEKEVARLSFNSGDERKIKQARIKLEWSRDLSTKFRKAL